MNPLQPKVIRELKKKGWLVINFHANGRTQRGIPDLLAISPSGGFVFIEIKYGKDRLSKIQEAFIEELTDRGVKVIICKSLDDIKCLIGG